MHILPYLEYRIHSSKSPEEICAILGRVTKSLKETAYRPYIEFLGEVHPFEFEIMENICFRNDYLPMISGKVWTDQNESIIDIKMNLHPSVYKFTVFGMGMIGCFSFITVLAAITGELEVTPPTAFILVIAFIAFHQLMIWTGFYLPAKKSIQKLEKLLG